MSKQIAIVLASHLQEYFDRFLDSWKEEFTKHQVTLYLNEDHQLKEFVIPKNLKFEVKHYSWEDHQRDLGKNAWIIPHKTSAGKSFGFWKAYQDKNEIIISLDHDCYKDQTNSLDKHINQLSKKVTFGWISSCGMPTRGFPYQIREKTPVILNHGVWSNIPDFDGPQMLQYPDVRFPVVETTSTIVPKGNYFPLCGMNFAFDKIATPALYFLLQGPDWPFDRFDDIWAGIFFKKITDHLGYAIMTGYPSIHHDKGTDPFVAVQKEAPGLPVNEWLWQEVDQINLESQTFAECYIELAQGLKKSKKIEQSAYKDYFDKLAEAMIIWANLYE